MKNEGGDKAGFFERLHRTLLLNSDDVADRVLIQFQQDLVPRAALLGLGLLVVVFLRDYWNGTPALGTLREIAALGLLYYFSKNKASWTAPALRICLTLVTLSNVRDGLGLGQEFLPPQFVFFPILAWAATLLDSLALGLLITGINLLAVYLFAQGPEPLSPLLSSQLFHLSFVTMVFQTACVGQWYLLRALVRRYEDQGSRLDRENELSQKLLSALFELLSGPLKHFKRAVGKLQTSANTESADWIKAEDSGSEMEAVVRHTRDDQSAKRFSSPQRQAGTHPASPGHCAHPQPARRHRRIHFCLSDS